MLARGLRTCRQYWQARLESRACRAHHHQMPNSGGSLKTPSCQWVGVCSINAVTAHTMAKSSPEKNVGFSRVKTGEKYSLKACRLLPLILKAPETAFLWWVKLLLVRWFLLFLLTRCATQKPIRRLQAPVLSYAGANALVAHLIKGEYGGAWLPH